MKEPQKILIIQTAFIGDVILATALIENVAKVFPNAKIYFLLRKGNESLLDNNPNVAGVLIWQKKEKKLFNFLKLIKEVRKNNFDLVINVHRFLSSGILTVFSGAKIKIGFRKNPLSRFFSKAYEHEIKHNNSNTIIHEVDRNNKLLSGFEHKVSLCRRPSLFPSHKDYDIVIPYKQAPYVTISPASIWFTKQWPVEKWVELISKTMDYHIFLLGGNEDMEIASQIINLSNRKEGITNLCGQLSFLQSGALMKDSEMNFCNDSAPQHIASAMNAPVTTIFCSTIPEFGFGPLSERSYIWQTGPLYCRPCGLHGFKACPEGHFKCAWDIEIPSKPF